MKWSIEEKRITAQGKRNYYVVRQSSSGYVAKVYCSNSVGLGWLGAQDVKKTLESAINFCRKTEREDARYKKIEGELRKKGSTK